MADDQAGREWVQRVLGVALSGAGGTGRKASFLAIWRDAKESVDAAIGALAGELRATGDPDLERIAEFGLFGLTEGEGVALMAALREADANPARAQGRLTGAIGKYREFLAGSQVVTLIDRNPFGVQVSMRATLGHALDEMEQQLAA